MPSERFGLNKFSGRDQTFVGDGRKIVHMAQEFTIRKTVCTMGISLKQTHQKVPTISYVFSVSGSVCERETCPLKLDSKNKTRTSRLSFNWKPLEHHNYDAACGSGTDLVKDFL